MKDITITELIEQGFIKIGEKTNGVEFYAAFIPEELSSENFIECHITNDGKSWGMINIPLEVLENIYNNKDKLKRIEVKEEY